MTRRWLAPLARLWRALWRLLRSPYERRLERAATERVVDYYRTLLIDLGAIVWEFDLAEERVTMVSESCVPVLGYTARQMRETPRLWRESQHPDDQQRSMQMRERLSGGEGQDVYEHRMIRADGRIIWLQTAVRGARGAHRHPLLRGVSLDITPYKRASSELQDTLSLLQATLDATDNGILVVGLDGRIASYNQKFSQMWGLGVDVMGAIDETAAGTHGSPLVKDPERFLKRRREINGDPLASSFDLIEFKDGRVLERTSQPQRVGGKTVGRVWSYRDLTERMRTERALRLSNEQLQQAQKMEAVGQLAGGVAHDFNNILTAVLGNLSLILADPAVPLGVRQRAEEIQLASERASNLTRQLLAFGRRQVLSARIEYLCVIVVEMLKLLRLSAGERIRIDLDLMPHPCPVLVERGPMEQVILNLVINARDAMPSGGRIVIATRRVDVDPSRPHSYFESPAGQHILLSVSDDGEGMDGATLARVFEPFFTTKDRGRGTGLGLATAYGMVQQSGGFIDVRSTPGQGTTFDILLPYSPQLPQSGDASPSADRPSGAAGPGAGIETVMVVEDEPPLRGMMRDALARVGYRVIEAPNGQDALELATMLPGGIEALVTDIAMAGLGGVDLAARLRDPRPRLRVLFVTGLGLADLGAAAGLPGGASVLHKPFTMDTLLRRVREALDGPGGQEWGG